MLLVFLLSMVAGSATSARAASTITFTAEELLGKPESTSITINIVPDSTIEYHYQYGLSAGANTWQTANVTATAGQPSEITITGLTANMKYYYRMQYHTPGDAMNDWVNRTEHSFWTQRAPGSTFKFTIVSDSHAMYNTQYQQAMTSIASDQPDFHFDLGDTFMVDNTTTQSAVNTAYLAQRELVYMDRIGHSVPIFLASGNHENEEGWNLDDAFSIAQASIQARKLYFPTPTDEGPGGFYSGNTDPLAAINAATYGDKFREDYYAWTWGDALFVVFDPFQYTMNNPYGATAGESNDETVSGDRWNWTLGLQQYNWLKQTLENSNAKYKFMFAHHMLGGTQNYVRGGAVPAHMFEWGGYDADGTTWGWDTKRPTFGAKPIRQLMIDNGVSAFFHGHDHQYAYEVRDGIVYLSMPRPSTGLDFNYYLESDPYTERVMASPGYLRVTIAPAQATVEYVTSSNASGTVQHSFTIAPNTPVVTHDLTVAVDPAGGGTTVPTVGTHAYAEDSAVTITATPNVGYAFANWSGDCSGSGLCQVTMAGNKSVTAHFTIVPTHSLTTAVNPPGGGTIDPAAGAHTYSEGAVVNITAAANTGYVFASWSGDCGGTNPNSCSVTMDTAKTVTANFTLLPTYVLTMATDGHGTTSPAVGGHSYPQGSVVPISATPNSGYVFDSWAGDADCADGSVTMNADKTCTANFVTAPPGVTVDGAASSGTGAPTASSVSFSHTTGTSADRLMLVGVSWNCGTTNRTLSSISFTPAGGSALNLTEVRTQQYSWTSGSNTNYRYTAIYRLLNPPSGVAGTVNIAFSGAVSNGIIAGAANFAGVDQTTPLGSPNGAVGTGTSTSGTPNPTVTLTGLAGSELVFDSVFMGASSTSHTMTADSGQAELWNILGYSSSSTSFNARGAASTKQATGTTATMSWTTGGYGTTATRWAIAAVPINPAPARPAAPVASINATQLMWTSVAGATSYEVYMSTSAPYFTPGAAVYTGPSPYTLPSGTINYYVVRAFMGAVPSPNSNRVGRFSFSLTPGQ